MVWAFFDQCVQLYSTAEKLTYHSHRKGGFVSREAEEQIKDEFIYNHTLLQCIRQDRVQINSLAHMYVMGTYTVMLSHIYIYSAFQLCDWFSSIFLFLSLLSYLSFAFSLLVSLTPLSGLFFLEKVRRGRGAWNKFLKKPIQNQRVLTVLIKNGGKLRKNARTNKSAFPIHTYTDKQSRQDVFYFNQWV